MSCVCVCVCVRVYFHTLRFKAYIEQHISVSQASGKPYIIEEFNVLIQ